MYSRSSKDAHRHNVQGWRTFFSSISITFYQWKKSIGHRFNFTVDNASRVPWANRRSIWIIPNRKLLKPFVPAEKKSCWSAGFTHFSRLQENHPLAKGKNPIAWHQSYYQWIWVLKCGRPFPTLLPSITNGSCWIINQQRTLVCNNEHNLLFEMLKQTNPS